MHPDDRDYVDQKWTAAMRGEPYDIEHRIVVDGAVKWVREQAELEFNQAGELLGGFGTAQDITARKRPRQALRESEERLRLLGDNLPESAVYQYLHEPDGRTRFLHISAGIEALNGVRAQDVMNDAGDAAPADSAGVLRAPGRGRGQECPRACRLRHGSADAPARRRGALDAAALEAAPAAGRPHRLGRRANDITARKQAEEEQRLTISLLNLVNAPTNVKELLAAVTKLLKEWSGCEAVGIRLRQGEDFPYGETNGFPAAFVQLENSLCARDPAGKLRRDSQGNPVLECMCGNVIRGRFNPDLPFFTPGGASGPTAPLSSWPPPATRTARPAPATAATARATSPWPWCP